MKIPVTLQPLIDATRREVPSLLRLMQVGQVLPAKVLAELQPGLLRLQIATTELLARSQVSVPAGTALKLEVIKAYPVPELRILRPPTAMEQRQQVVRSALARQMPPDEVRQAVGELRNTAQTPRQAEAVRQLSTLIQQAGIRFDQLTPGQLQRAVTLSGLFHEARLLAGTAAPQAGDIKLQLLQLLSSLAADDRPQHRPGPPSGGEQAAAPRDGGTDSLINRLVRLIEGSLARIQLQQSAALPVDESPRQAWQLDLPVQLRDRTDDVKLRIEREAANGDAGDDAAWSVNLAFQFDTIGTLQCRVALTGDRVATTFWCEQSTTQQRLEQRLPNLRDALEAQGLEVVHLAGVLGEPPEPLIHVAMPDQLLDERA